MRMRELASWTCLGLLGISALGGCDDAAVGTGGSGGSPATTGVGASGPGATGSSVTSSGAGGAPTFMGSTRVDAGSGAAVAGSATAAVAPNGDIYVSWVEEGGASRDLFVARSTDGGKSFGPAVKIDDDTIVPLVAMARRPYVAADGARVAVVFNDQAGGVYLYSSDAAASSFGQPTMIGTDITTTFRDFPKAVFLPDGSLGVAYHGYPSSGARIFFSRESTGFVSEDASGGAPGLPCECCPLDVHATSSGDLVLAFRNNDTNTREMWFADAPGAGAFSAWGTVSTTEGFLDTCPMQGPRIAEPSAGKLFSVWSARGQGNANTGAVYLSTSTDGGASWSGGAPLAGFVADDPTIAAGASGHLFVTGATGAAKGAVVSSTDGGSTWSAPAPLAATDGTLGTPEAAGNGTVAVAAAVSSAGTVWLTRFE